MCAAYDDGPQVVGLDLHRRRTVMVRMTPTGEQLEQVRFANSRAALAAQIAKAGPAPRVVLEATYGWYWAVDTLAAAGARVHLAHPLGVKGFAYRRVKNDVRDAADLADLLRMGRLPQAWIAPPAVRELRELVRHRHKLRQSCSGFKAQVHAVLAKNGLTIECADIFGVGGRQRLAVLVESDVLPAVFAERIDSQLRLIDMLEAEITAVNRELARRLADRADFRAIQRIGGVGPVFAAVFVAEIGDVTRFPTPGHLAAWAGLTPRHRESDTTVHRGPITKQGSRIVRWAAVEAVQRAPAGTPPRLLLDRIVAKRGKNATNCARIAAARLLLELVYYGLRDGHIRRLDRPDAPDPATP
jgi:transposase